MEVCSSSSQSPESFAHFSAEECQEANYNDEESKTFMRKSKKKKKKKKNRDVLKESSATTTTLSSSSTSSSLRTSRVAFNRRRPRVALVAPRRRIDVAEAVSFRLGMSIAAFLSQIMEAKDGPSELMSADHLAMICASAVRESLANDFGDAFDSFVSNFEKSFRSTFRTLRLIKESSINKGNGQIGQVSVEDCTSGGACVVQDCHSEKLIHTNVSEDQSESSEIVEVNEVADNLELALHGQMNQLTRFIPNPFGPTTNRSTLSTIEKSVMEQTRSNDLKTMELSLMMEKLKMKSTQLTLNLDSNNLERSKLAMGACKASFKAEKFKTQLEDFRNAELLTKCVDCLVASLIIMTGSLIYSVYVYSYNKITDATASCMPSTKKSSSWWFSNPVDKFNSGLQMLSCQFQVLFRLLFGFLMIFLIVYLLLRRSASSRQTLPITFIILLLGLLCGTVGKICVDTLGGSGYHWLVFWEIICSVHFVCNVYTSALFAILYGPLPATQESKYRNSPRIAYWVRRLMFYGAVLIFLPLLCGLIPFASVKEWKDHFLSRIFDNLHGSED